MRSQKNCRRTLAKAFGKLTDTQLNRLKWHADRNSPVLCGRLSDEEFVHPDTGFG
jgi:hypothetical protein